MFDNYDDACEAEISRKQAMHEVARHYCEWEEFVKDCGDKDSYEGKIILDWLGY